MKIAYIDLKLNNPPEDYSLNPKRYGGGAVVARYGKELLNRSGDVFHLFAAQECFDNLTIRDNRAVCIPVPEPVLAGLRSGKPVKDAIPDAESYDLFLHHHDCQSLNMAGLKAPLVHWALMGDGRANWGAAYSLLYLHHERAQQGKSLYVQLGKPIPPYAPRPKEDFLFQCTRHDPHMNSIEVAQECIKHGLKVYFAGPIAPGYDLMSHIDNRHTFYLGAIDDATKLDYLSRARATPLLFKWDTPFNQSAVEALSVGTPLIINPRGFLKVLVKDGENGVVYGGNLLDAWNRALALDSLKCRASVERYSEVNMIASFRSALTVALLDWKATHP